MNLIAWIVGRDTCSTDMNSRCMNERQLYKQLWYEKCEKVAWWMNECSLKKLRKYIPIRDTILKLSSEWRIWTVDGANGLVSFPGQACLRKQKADFHFCSTDSLTGLRRGGKRHSPYVRSRVININNFTLGGILQNENAGNKRSTYGTAAIRFSSTEVNALLSEDRHFVCDLIHKHYATSNNPERAFMGDP